MLTPADEEILRRLRALQAQRDHANGLYDRFGDEQFSRQAHTLAAEIASFPAHILRADQISTTLQALTYAVEDYLIARAAQFLPDAADLWAAVESLPGNSEKRESPAEIPILRLLAELRALGADEAALKNAVLQAAALESYKNPSVLRRAGQVNRSKDYRVLLRRHIGDFLKKQPMPSAAALVATVQAWQQETDSSAGQDTFWTRYYRQTILSAVAVLKKLGSSDEEIIALIAEGYSPRRERHRRQ